MSSSNVEVTGARSLLASLATALTIAALMLVPSEAIRMLCPRTMRRRVFQPRIARMKSVRHSVVPSPPAFPFSWLVLAWAVDDTEQSVVDELGLDACVYIGTARLGLRIFLATAWFDLGLVLPVNCVLSSYRPSNVDQWSDLDRFTIAHVAPQSRLLWVHAASAILKTFAVLALLDRYSSWVQAQQLRARRAAATVAAPAQRTVLVTQVPPHTDVETVFRGWYGDAVESVTPVMEPGLLSVIVAEKVARTKELEAARRQLAAGGPRPTRRVPPWLPCGEVIDVLDYCEEMLLECNSRLAAARRGVLSRPPERKLLRNAAFVTFRTARDATVAGQVVHGTDTSTWVCKPAPEPGNVVWRNVGSYSSSAQLALQLASWGATLCFCFLYLVPAAAIQSFTFAASLSRAFPPLRRALASPATQSLVEGVLPGVLLFLLAWIWPIFLRLFTVWQGVSTHSDTDRGQTSKSFFYNVLVAFVSTVLSGAVWAGLAQAISNPSQIPVLLAIKIPATSRFFMTYCLLQGVGGGGAMMARWWPAVQYMLRSRAAAAARRGAAHGKRDTVPGAAAVADAATAVADASKDDEAALWPPFHQPFGRFFPRILLQIQILVIFSTIAPLMQVVSLFYFLPAITAAKCKMLYAHEKDYEGYGRMWPLVRSCVCIILVVYQLTIAGLLGLKGAIYPAWVTGVACIPLTLILQRRMALRYNPSMYGAVPIELHTEVERKAARRTTQARASQDGAASPAPAPKPAPAPEINLIDCEIEMTEPSGSPLAAWSRSILVGASATDLVSLEVAGDAVPLPPGEPQATPASPPPLPQLPPPPERRTHPYLHPDLDVDESLANDAALTLRYGQSSTVPDVVLRGIISAGSSNNGVWRLVRAIFRRGRKLTSCYCGLLVDNAATADADEEEAGSPPQSVIVPVLTITPVTPLHYIKPATTAADAPRDQTRRRLNE
jgi:hypothetical protein